MQLSREEIAFIVLVSLLGLLLIFNLYLLFSRRGNKKIDLFAEQLAKGQAELAGRLSSLSENNLRI